MGVQGLWKLVEPCGRMVPLEGMSNKVLAVDVSIWLHQAMKGMHDVQGAPIAVAHLLVLFHRLCKLLFYKIKPVFVFDGGVPALKRKTVANRRIKKSTARSEASRVRGKLLKNLLKHEAIRHVMSDEAATAALGLTSLTLPGPSEEEDLYKLPPAATQTSASNTSASSASESEVDEDADGGKYLDIHSLDVGSSTFKALPAEVRHDILSDIKDTRKQSSWRHLDQMPQQSQDFSDFQMNRLLKRRAVQVSLEECGKEMGARDVSMQELQGLLGDGFSSGSVLSGRVAQTDTTHFMLIQKPQNLIHKSKQDNPKKGLVEASQGFDISEHLEDVMWSSDSEGESTLMNESNESENVDGDLKPNQLPLSQLLSSASAKIVDDITAVLEEGIEVEKVVEEQLIDVPIVKIEYVDEKIDDILVEDKLDKRRTKSEKDVTDILSVLEDNEIKDSQSTLASSGYYSQLTVPLEEDPKEIKNDMGKMEMVETSSKEKHLKIAEENIEETTSLSNVYKIEIEETKNISRDKEVITQIDENLEKDKVVINSEITNKTKIISGDQEMIDYLENIAIIPPIIEDSKDEKSETNSETIKGGKMISCNNDTKDVPPIPQTIEEDNFGLEGSPGKSIKDLSSDSDEDFLPVDDLPPVYPEKSNEAMTVVESPEIEKFPQGLSESDMKEMRKNLENEMDSLLSEKGRQERMAQNVTDQMCADAQELLRLFGVPYIVAPMEAEAQCAALDLLGLTEGTITDDSDIWLFGGRIVYKNFFNQKKHVLEYRSEDISQYFKLTREEMVRLAMLVGSDYTPGLPGVGPVTALEVLAAFPSPKNPHNSDQLLIGLQKFQEWVASGFIVGPTRASLRNKVKNTSLLPGFPSRAVVEAYLQPAVDNSNEQFSWAKPDMQLLEKYAKLKFGWSSERCNELLMPVMKKLLETTDQPTIDRFFRVLPAPTLLEGRLSKRVEGAVKRLGRPMEPEDSDSDGEKAGTSQSKKSKPSETKSKKNPLCLDSLTERLHKKTVIPQKEKDRLMREELKKKAAELLKRGGVRGRGKSRGGLVVKSAPYQSKVNLSDSSDSN